MAAENQYGFFRDIQLDDHGRMLVDNSTISSVGNTSTTPITSGDTFTGATEFNSEQDVMVVLATDVNGTLYIEFSTDGINWDTSLRFYYNTSRINPPHILTKGPRYFRVRFENTTTDNQTYFRLNTYYGSFSQLTSPINGTLAENYDATVVRPTDYKSEVGMGKRQGRAIWNKFGYNLDSDIGTEVVASWGGTFTPLTTATTISIVSTSANDVTGGTGTNTVVVYGIDADRNEVIEVINMNGLTPVVTTSTWLGINRVAMYLCGSGKVNAGTIEVDAVSDSSVMAQMPLVGGVTQQCIFHIPANHTFLAESLWINVLNRGKNAELTVTLWVYSAVSNGKQAVFHVDIDTSKITGPLDLEPNLPFPITEKSVMWLECTTDTNDVTVNARFSGILERNK